MKPTDNKPDQVALNCGLCIGNIMAQGVVCSIQEKKVTLRYEKNGRVTYRHLLFEDLQGEPLNDDWYQKLGFRKYPGPEWKLPKDRVPFTDMVVVYEHGRHMLLYFGSYVRDVIYVHEIQNIAHFMEGHKLPLEISTPVTSALFPSNIENE